MRFAARQRTDLLCAERLILVPGHHDPGGDCFRVHRLTNRHLNALYESAIKRVPEGTPLHRAFEGDGLLPPASLRLVAVGEESGQLETMLSKIADFYEAEVDAKIRALTALIEPLMIIMVGGVVGFIVISMYLPIFSLYDKIR